MKLILVVATFLVVHLSHGQVLPFSYMRSDPFFDRVVLLMPMETGFSEVKNHSVTYVTSPTLSATNIPSPYGTQCVSFGLGRYLQLPDSNDWVLGTTHTVECWIRPTSSDLSSIHTFILQRDGGSTGYQWGFYQGKIFHWAGSGTSVFDYNTPGTPTITAGVAFHFAAVYDAASATEKIRVYINGIKVLTSATQPTLLDYAAYLAIGGDNQSYGQDFYGTLKDFRVTKGVARYNANFTPPASFYASK